MSTLRGSGQEGPRPTPGNTRKLVLEGSRRALSRGCQLVSGLGQDRADSLPPSIYFPHVHPATGSRSAFAEGVFCGWPRNGPRAPPAPCLSRRQQEAQGWGHTDPRGTSQRRGRRQQAPRSAFRGGPCPPQPLKVSQVLG